MSVILKVLTVLVSKQDAKGKPNFAHLQTFAPKIAPRRRCCDMNPES